jgi:hypothetical protein
LQKKIVENISQSHNIDPCSRYDLWLRGEDYGRHPVDPVGKASAAPQPTAEEFIFNPKNKDKPIPLCLLEPNTSKKRRHPIHKKKSIGAILVS